MKSPDLSRTFLFVDLDKALLMLYPFLVVNSEAQKWGNL